VVHLVKPKIQNFMKESVSATLVLALVLLTMIGLTSCGTNRCGHRMQPSGLEPMLMKKEQNDKIRNSTG